MKSKLFLFAFAFILLAGMVSAFEFDNIKSYNPIEKKVTIKNAFGLGSNIAKVKLNTDLNVIVPAGYQKVAEFEINSYVDYEQAIKTVELYNIKDNMKKINRQIDFKYKTYKQVEVLDYVTECTPIDEKEGESLKYPNGTIINNSVKENCVKVQKGSHFEDKDVWNDLSSMDMKAERLTIGLFTNVEVGDKVEWIPNLYGVRVEEWASWTSDLNVGLVSFWKLDETSGNAIDSLGRNNLTDTNSVGSSNGLINKSRGTFPSGGNKILLNTSAVSVSKNKNYTMSIWMNKSIVEVSETPSLFMLSKNDAGTQELRISQFPSDEKVYAVIGKGHTAEWKSNVGYLPIANKWTHYVLVYNANTFNASLYVNGTFIGSVAQDSTASDTTGVSIGAGMYNSGHNAQDLEYAYLDSAGLWNRTLTSAEINAIFQAGLSGFDYTTVLDNAPTITLNSPANNTNFTTSSVTFNVSVTDDVKVQNVSLYINGVLNETNTTGLNGTYLFTKSFSDARYNWSIIAFDNNSQSTSSTTRTFLIDTIFPTISVTGGNGTQNYGNILTNHTLNYTITDTPNLQSCWMNYNGTNRTIPCTSGALNTTNFTLRLGTYNATIYANDTVGNVNSSFVNWSYKVFENSRTFTTPVTETTLDTFTINVTSDLSLSSVYLNYNGTEYSTSLSGGVYTRQLTIPVVNVSAIRPVFWRFVYAGTNITSSITNQTVVDIVFQLCSPTVNITLFNFTTKSATSPFPLVNSTFKSDWTLAASSSATPTTFNYEDTANNKSSYAFCTNTNATTFYLDSGIQYDATGYALNYYYLNNVNVSATTNQNIILYLLNDSAATTTVLRVQDTSQVPKEGYYIQIQAYDVGTGTFYTVGMAKTDYKGEDVVYLNWFDTLYKFIVLDSSLNVVKTTSTTKISATPTIIEISDYLTLGYEKFQGFVYNLYYQNSTSNFILTFTKPSGEVDSACLRVFKEDVVNSTLICNECETSSSATLFCNIGAYGNGTYQAVFYATGSFDIIATLKQIIGGSFATTIYNALGNEDASMYAFLFASLVTIALFINAAFGIVALLIGILGASALGFTIMAWGEFIGIIAIGGLILWLMKR